jgi:hypothetical protein
MFLSNRNYLFCGEISSNGNFQVSKKEIIICVFFSKLTTALAWWGRGGGGTQGERD